MVRVPAFQAGHEGSIPSTCSIYVGIAQLVEYHVANVIVVGSNPTTYSNFRF